MAVGPQGNAYPAARLPQQCGSQTAHLSVSDHQGGPSLQCSQMLPQNLHSPVGRRGRHAAEPPARLGGLAAGGSSAEECLQHAVGAASFPRQGHGSFDLGEDLILSQDLGAQSAGHFHQMAGTVDSPPGDEGMVKRAGGNPGGLAKQHPGIEILSLAQGEVDFRAVAGGQHHGSRQPSSTIRRSSSAAADLVKLSCSRSSMGA